MAPDSSSLLVIRDCDLHTRTLNFTIDFPPSCPPEVYFDTNVWLGMSDSDVESLQAHKNQRGYRYRYSVTNYIEMLSRLGEDQHHDFQIRLEGFAPHFEGYNASARRRCCRLQKWNSWNTLACRITCRQPGFQILSRQLLQSV